MIEINITPHEEIMAVSSTKAVRFAKAPTDPSRANQNDSATQGSGSHSLTMMQVEKTPNTRVVRADTLTEHRQCHPFEQSLCRNAISNFIVAISSQINGNMQSRAKSIGRTAVASGY